jgi:ABC-type branched-subunit amino acid transport system substrate-binding protein
MQRSLCPLPFALALALAACVPRGVRADDIVLGMSAAFKGPSRGLGIELYRGSMAYFAHVNQMGGVGGRKIVIKAYDDGYNPVPAIANTVQLIEKDRPLLLYGYVGTPTVTRVLPLLRIYQDYPAYLFFPFTGAEPQRRAPYRKYVFNLRASYAQETRGLVDHFVRLGRKRIALFYQIDAYGRSGWDGVRTALTEHGLFLEAEATYARGTPYGQSMRVQVDLLRKKEPDAVIAIGAYAACAAFIRDARDAGWDVPIANISFVGSESLLALLQEEQRATGRDYTGNLINSQVVPSYHRVGLPVVREYRLLADRYNPMPPAELRDADYVPLRYSFVGLEGFLNAKVLVEVLRRMGDDLDRKRLKDVVESIHQLDVGLPDPISFGSGRHQGSDAVYFTTVVDGRFVQITDWARWAK